MAHQYEVRCPACAPPLIATESTLALATKSAVAHMDTHMPLLIVSGPSTWRLGRDAEGRLVVGMETPAR